MGVEQDSEGRDLRVGDPVTVCNQIVKGGHGYGRRSHGTVASFGPVNVQVHITDSDWGELIGNTVPVKGDSLTYGHKGHVRLGDQLAEIVGEGNAVMEKAKQDHAESVLCEVIKLAKERGIITVEQGRELWLLQDEIPPQAP
ncbi:hypothetical protein ACFXNW_18110 [Nocardia sp. NPDC059180]|uniref:hypothetical protein n=1 Tax=Nocardia sp. NPDC059180 TaxID=3346761 RepID=UPI0036D1E66C